MRMYLSLSQRHKLERQDDSWNSITWSQQGDVFVGTVIVAQEVLKR